MTSGFIEPMATRELGAGEHLLWTGQPRGGIRLQVADALLIPFSLMWCGFAVFWEYEVVSQGAPFFFMIWGIPFVCVGLFLVFGRFIADARQRDKTWYALTNERVIISSGLFSRTVRSLPLRTLGEVSFVEKSDFSGTITFGSSGMVPSWMMGTAWPGMGRSALPTLQMIDNARSVYDMIRSAQKTS
jgi:hypothetical protein